MHNHPIKLMRFHKKLFNAFEYTNLIVQYTSSCTFCTLDFDLKGVLAKIERGYRLTSKN